MFYYRHHYCIQNCAARLGIVMAQGKLVVCVVLVGIGHDSACYTDSSLYDHLGIKFYTVSDI